MLLVKILYIIVTLWVIITIIYYGRRPTKSISWVLVAIVLPFAGPLLYYFFGINRRKFKFFHQKEFERRNNFQDLDFNSQLKVKPKFQHDERYSRLNKLIECNSKTYASSGNEITILNDGKPTFEALFSTMQQAKKFIHVQYYMLEKGELLDKMLKLFREKIDQGVVVRIIYDSFGSYSLRGSTKKRFEEIGVKIYPMMPIRLGNLLFSLNFRNHRKIVVVDGNVAFTGGVNVSDKYIKDGGALGKWKDIHLKLKGPIVQSLHGIFLKDYFYACEKNNFKVDDYLPKLKEEGDVVAQIVAGGPDSEQPVIMQQYMAMINLAKKSIYIVNPYFLPGEPFLQTIKLVVLQGVEVNLLTPKKLDSAAAKFAMFSQFDELLKIGVNIYVRNDFSHSKILIVDDDLLSIGSGNFDNRSFEHNYETNVMIYDKTLCAKVKNEIVDHCENAKKLEFEVFKNRPSWQRFLEGFAKFFKPLL